MSLGNFEMQNEKQHLDEHRLPSLGVALDRIVSELSKTEEDCFKLQKTLGHIASLIEETNDLMELQRADVITQSVSGLIVFLNTICQNLNQDIKINGVINNDELRPNDLYLRLMVGSDNNNTEKSNNAENFTAF